jgi:hypothetical protein
VYQNLQEQLQKLTESQEKVQCGVSTLVGILVGGLEHYEFYFSIYWEFHHPN